MLLESQQMHSWLYLVVFRGFVLCWPVVLCSTGLYYGTVGGGGRGCKGVTNVLKACVNSPCP